MTDTLIKAVAQAIKYGLSVTASPFGYPLVDHHEDAARAAIAAIAAIEAAGYRIVPVEPTERMKDAMWLRLPRLRQATSEELRHALKDSIAAAPKVIP